jgi:type IV fimbrial biogenesis protein FimT
MYGIHTGKNRPAPTRSRLRRLSDARLPREAGVTLIELIVVITVAAILISIGIPSYKNITNSYRIAGEVNGLLGDMQFARAEAIKEGQSVTICVSSNGTTCSGEATWQNGWTVFPDPTQTHAAATSAPSVLRVQPAFSGSDTFVEGSGVSYVTFNREGLATGLPATGALVTLHESTDNTYYTRCLQVTSVGAMQVVQHSSYGSCE